MPRQTPPPSSITVRHAEPADAPAIAALYAQLVSNPAVSVRPERIAQLAREESGALFVGEIGQRAVGTVLVCLCDDVMFNDQPFAVVENIVVDAACRSAGVGRALLAAVEAYCLARQCSKIMLLSSAEREHAHRFFERAGFAGSLKRGFVKYRRSFAGPGLA